MSGTTPIQAHRVNTPSSDKVVESPPECSRSHLGPVIYMRKPVKSCKHHVERDGAPPADTMAPNASQSLCAVEGARTSPK